MKRKRDYYGLSPEFPESKTELLDGYMLAWTWKVEPDVGIGGTLWVNWFVMEAYEWHKRDSQGVSLARHDSPGSPPFDQYELPADQWREADFVASGFVKWDGCSQWDCDVHLDSRDERQKFFDVVHLAHQRAAEIMVKDFDGKAEEA